MMPIYLGGTRIDSLKLGGQNIAAGYLGTVKVFGSEPAAGFVPTDVTGCVGWWDADAITGLANNDPVTQWDDLSGQAHHVVSPGGTFDPTYKTGLLNGRPGVEFSQDVLTLDDNLGIGTAASVFAVMQYVTISGTGVVHGFVYVGSSNANGLGMTKSGSTLSDTNRSLLFGGVAFKNDGAYTLTPELWSYTHGTSTAMRVDGAPVTITNAASNPNSPSARFALGGYHQGSFYQAFSGTCRLFEVVVYDNEVSSTDRDAIESYLLTKWGL
jgi:hypothetical protein